MQILNRSIIVFFMAAWTMFSPAQQLKLFNPEIRDAAAYPHRVVMDFVERYFNIDLPNQRQLRIRICRSFPSLFHRAEYQTSW